MKRSASAAFSGTVACALLALVSPARADMERVQFDANNFRLVAGPPKTSPISDIIIDMTFDPAAQVGGQTNTSHFSLLLNGDDQFYTQLTLTEAQTPAGTDYYTVDFLLPAAINYHINLRIFDNVAQVSYTKWYVGGPFHDKWQSTVATMVSSVPAMVLSVPEPQEYALMLAGLGVLSLVARRQKR